MPSYDPDQLLKLGMMSALVVGDGDKEVDVDEMGRIAVLISSLSNSGAA